VETLTRSLVQLKKAMLGLEADLGILDLSEVDKTILISITEVCEVSGEFNSQDLRQHDLVKNIPSASYHRSLKSLQNSGFIKKQADRSRSKYFMTSKFSASEK
jgi:predicted transcriptional regulator